IVWRRAVSRNFFFLFLFRSNLPSPSLKLFHHGGLGPDHGQERGQRWKRTLPSDFDDAGCREIRRAGSITKSLGRLSWTTVAAIGEMLAPGRMSFASGPPLFIASFPNADKENAILDPR
ncbi:uncharacterized protein CCOS01_08574, partial [Colletotrichum costaricense]